MKTKEEKQKKFVTEFEINGDIPLRIFNDSCLLA